MPALYSYLHPDGGWRQVEVMHFHQGIKQSVVRDCHRGEVYWVQSDKLIPVTKYKGPQP